MTKKTKIRILKNIQGARLDTVYRVGDIIEAVFRDAGPPYAVGWVPKDAPFPMRLQFDEAEKYNG